MAGRYEAGVSERAVGPALGEGFALEQISARGNAPGQGLGSFMFESLTNRLQDVFKTLRGETRLTPENAEAALREIRLALLEADVNFKVVKAFIDRVRDRAMGQDVLRSLSPSQQVVKIVRDEMVALFGDAEGGLRPTSAHTRVVLLLG